MHKIGTRCFLASGNSVNTEEAPRIRVGKGGKLWSNREKAPVFTPIAPRFSELSGGFLEKRPFIRPEVGKRGKYTAQPARRNERARLHKPAGKDKKKAKPAQWQALL